MSPVTLEEKQKLIDRMKGYHMGPRYSKTNLLALEKAGVMTIRDYLAGMNNLLDPFARYNMKTLRLERETPAEWVMLAEYKGEDNPWPVNRLYFEKQTGFLKKVEAEIKDIQRTVILLEVKKVTPVTQLPSDLFRMEIPPTAYVNDQTDMYLENAEIQQKIKGEYKSKPSGGKHN